MSEALLKVEGLQVRYGAIEAVKSLDLHIDEGERVTLIGANGAGKSSSLKALTGLLPAAKGEIRFAGQSILGQAPEKLLRQGIAMVPEGRGIFARMSVLETSRQVPFCAATTSKCSAKCANCSNTSRAWRNACTNPPACSPAASNKCSPWPVRCCRAHAC